MERVASVERSPDEATYREDDAQSVAGAAGLACALLALSGLCGLAYESLWARRLGLFLGNAILLHMTVLAAFMGGLAGGSFLFGTRASRTANPLRLYGGLEFGIGLWGLLFPLLAGAAHRIAIASASEPAFKVGLVAALLLPPTVLMGGTYPALTAWFQKRAGNGAAGANWLYAANCTGAVAGVLLTGFVLLPCLGQFATSMAVGSFNAGIGAVALLASQTALAGPRIRSPRPDVRATESSPPRVILFAVCVSGATAFLYELVWTRLFALTLGSSTYSFTLMLAAFISGLAAGSLAATVPVSLRRFPQGWLAGCEVLIGIVIALSVPLYQRLPYWFWQARWLLRPVAESFWLYHLVEYGLTFAVMIVPTFLFGLTFPTAIRAAGARDEDIVSHAAAVYGWNTLGTLVGVIVAGGLLIPLLGLQATLQVGASLNLLLGGLLFVGGSGRLPGLFVAVGIGGLLFLLATPRWHPLSFAQGTFRFQAKPPRNWSAYLAALESHRVVYTAEDFGTTVAVLQGPDEEGAETLRLVVDGKTDASSYGDMPTQILLGQVPLFLKPDSKDVFVLGLGSGVTAWSALTHPIERLDCAELSQAVARALPLFDDANGYVREDRRFHLIVEDGKTALPAMPRRYDVIISEPPNPWISGVGNLFSVDFYRTAARRLKPGGLMAQWFHTYEFDDELVATIVRTFRAVFPHAVLFNSGGRDYILVGSRQPLRPDDAAMETRFARREVAEDLARIHLTRLIALLARQTHGPDATAALGRNGGINSDDLPLLEYLAPRAQYTGAVAQQIHETDERLIGGAGLFVNAYIARHPLSHEDCTALLTGLSDPRMTDRVLERRLLSDALRRWPNDPHYLVEMAMIVGGEGQEEQGRNYLRRAALLGDQQARGILQGFGSHVRQQDRPVFISP